MARRTGQLIYKLFFSLSLAVLALSILTCDNFYPNIEKNEEQIWTDVVFAEDEKTVTIYLDGGGVYVPKSRAMNTGLAKLGHDFFEVVFYYPGQATARASWESGQRAGISGVYRTEAGIDYRNVSRTPTANQGSAVLYVGRKEDKTLLALGRLATAGGASVITTETKSVTFNVEAIKAGASRYATTSSFYTGASSAPYGTPAEGKTIIAWVNLAGRYFPLYVLNDEAVSSRTVGGSYTFALTNGNFNDFSIVRAASGTTLDKLVAHYTEPNGEVYPKSPATFKFDNITTITMTNNLPEAVPGQNVDIQNPVLFNFEIDGALFDTMFSFSFSIAVHGFNSDADAVRWFLRPGYGRYLHDLDNGAGGAGGAILVGVGEFDQTVITGFQVTEKPTQLNYNGTNGWKLNLTGIRLAMMKSDGTLDYAVNEVTGSPYGPVEYSFSSTGPWETYAQIQTKIFTDADKGYHDVWVRFTDNNLPPDNLWLAKFEIYVGELVVDFKPSNIPNKNRRFISNTSDLTYIQNQIQQSTGNEVFLMVLNNSIDVGALNINGGPHTVIILAGNENVILGRDGGGSFGNAQGNNIYYLGQWPYSDPIHVGGNVVISYPFKINAGGSWVDVQTSLDAIPPGTAGALLPGNSQYAADVSSRKSNATVGATASKMFTNVTANNLDNHLGPNGVYSLDFLR